MPPSSPLVLCVDDDREDLLFITTILEQLEPSVTTAEAYDGVEALDYLNACKASGCYPCFILLDINMPRLNGKQALALIKADPELRAIPVVVFSTSTMPSDRLYCAQYGVEMVSKPDTAVQLEQVLKKLLSQVLLCG